jgi:hypothetical protein
MRIVDLYLLHISTVHTTDGHAETHKSLYPLLMRRFCSKATGILPTSCWASAAVAHHRTLWGCSCAETSMWDYKTVPCIKASSFSQSCECTPCVYGPRYDMHTEQLNLLTQRPCSSESGDRHVNEAPKPKSLTGCLPLIRTPSMSKSVDDHAAFVCRMLLLYAIIALCCCCSTTNF